MRSMRDPYEAIGALRLDIFLMEKHMYLGTPVFAENNTIVAIIAFNITKIELYLLS